VSSCRRLRRWVRVLHPQRELRRIMKLPRDEREIELRKLAQELGASLASTYGGDGSKHLEEEVIRRIQEAGRSQREAFLWLVAVVAGVASVVSALAAWCAVLLRR